MSDFQLHAILRGVFIPMIVCGLTYVVARFTPSFLRDAFRAVGLAAAVLLSYLLLLGLPDWPLTGSPKGVVGALLLATVWAASENRFGRHQWLRRLLFTGAVAMICLRPFVIGLWPVMESLKVILSLASLTTLAWMIVDRGSEQMQPTGVLAALLVLTGTSAAYMGMTGSASLAQLTGALAAGLGIATVLSLFDALKPQREFNALVVLALLGLWCCHAFYVEIPWQQLFWLLSPILWFAVRDVLGRMSQTPLKDAVITAVVTLTPAAWGLWQIYKQMAASL